MNPFEFVIAIILITTIGSIIRNRQRAHGLGDRWRGRRGMFGRFDRDDADYAPEETGEAVRLREEVKMLKERIQTLERITVDKENSLAREIDNLRGR